MTTMTEKTKVDPIDVVVAVHLTKFYGISNA